MLDGVSFESPKFSKGLHIVLTPSVEWYSTGIIAGTVTNLAINGMKKVAEALSMVREVGIPLHVDVEELPIIKRPTPKENHIQFIVEILLVGSSVVSNDEGKRPNPDLYDLRIPLNVDQPLESGLETGEQLIDLLIFRNFTYVSSRTVLGKGRFFPQTVFDVFTPEPIGFMEAVKGGVAPDGGLYVPRSLPKLTRAELMYLQNYPGKGKYSIDRYHRTALFITERMMGLPKELTIDIEAIREAILEKVEEVKMSVSKKFGSEISQMQAASKEDPSQKLLELQQKAAAGDARAGEALEKAMAAQEAAMADVKKRFDEEIAKVKSKMPPRIYDTLIKIGQMITGSLPPRYGADVPRAGVWSKCVDEAYLPEKFGNNVGTIAPMFSYINPKDLEPFINKRNLTKFDKENILAEEMTDIVKYVRLVELYNGPTHGHKDFGMQIYPAFFKLANENEPKDREHFVVCVTKGEAGIAAVDALLRHGPRNLRVMVMYPASDVTLVQRAHLGLLHDGWRVNCVEVDDTYDNLSATLRQLLNDKTIDIGNKSMACINSVNYGRMLPMVIQFAQYFADMKLSQEIDTIQGFDVVVPCGNLGSVAAALIAREMNIPIRTIVIACNDNDAMVKFTQTGVFKKSGAVDTDSPHLDIAVGGNLERILFMLCKMDTNSVRKYMQSLETNGSFELDKTVFEEKVKGVLVAYSCDDSDTKGMIAEVFNNTNEARLIGPDTAVAVYALKEYMRGIWNDLSNSQKFPIVVAATSHWAKSPETVLKAIKKPLGDYRSLSMDTPKGWEPATGFACCSHPEVRGEEQPPHLILLRYYLTLLRDCPKAGNIPHALRHLSTQAPRLPVVEVGADYAEIVAEVQEFANKDWYETYPLDEFFDTSAGLRDFL